MYVKEYPQFTTVTCLDWNPVLENDREKEIVIDSMRFLVRNCRVKISAFVMMVNHFHLIWQVLGDWKRDEIQRDFLRFTGQQILKNFRNDRHPLLEKLLVEISDRKYQVWERDSLSVPLWSKKIFDQKLEYIHMNPVKAGLCVRPEDYKYSSARFYETNIKDWDFITHYDD